MQKSAKLADIKICFSKRALAFFSIICLEIAVYEPCEVSYIQGVLNGSVGCMRKARVVRRRLCRYMHKSDLPPAATVKFKCAKLHRALEGAAPVQEFNTIYDVLKSALFACWRRVPKVRPLHVESAVFGTKSIVSPL